jgi:hypothetical protein
MKKRKGRVHEIPALKEQASDDEVIRWVTTHDVAERLETGIAEVVEDRSELEALLDDALLQGNTTQLNMRIPRAMKAVLTRLAKERTTDATTLARIWLAERVRQETRSLG